MSHYVLFITAMCLATLLGRGSACTCVTPNVERMYCYSDYVIEVTIGDETSSLPNLDLDNSEMTPEEQSSHDMMLEQLRVYQYSVDIKEVFRANGDFEQVTKTLETAGASNLCGIRFTPGRTYVIMGYYIDGDNNETLLGSSLCGVNVPLDGEWEHWLAADVERVLAERPNCNRSPPELTKLHDLPISGRTEKSVSKDNVARMLKTLMGRSQKGGPFRRTNALQNRWT